MSRVPVLCVVACLAVAAPGSAQPPSRTEDPPSIVTVGRATVRTAPDRAFVTVGTEARAQAPAVAQQQIAQAMTAVRAALKAARLPDDAIRTVAYGLQEEVEFPNGKRVRRGYRAVNTIEVRVDEITRVGEVIDAAVKAGATDVQEIRFDLQDRAAVERDALRKAVADARARAEAAAAGGGVTIGGILRIDEQSQVVPMPRPMQAMAMRDAAVADVETPVSAGEIEVQATVTLTVAIR